MARKKANESAALTAEQYEREAVDYPDERGEALLDAAYAWENAGEPGRALSVYDRVIAEEPDEDVHYARGAKARLLWELGRRDEGDAELELLRKSAPGSGPAYLVGEYLEEQGRLKEALVWFERAVAADPLDPGNLVPEDTMARTEYEGRARVRAALGMPEDDMDRATRQNREKLIDQLDRFSTETAHGNGEPQHVVSAFARDEVEGAFAEGLVHIDDVDSLDADAYCRRMELYWREQTREAGVSRVRLHLATVDGLLAFASGKGADPRDMQTRNDYVVSEVGAGRSIAWPPERNAACWCGSGRKYKKCCGRPGS